MKDKDPQHVIVVERLTFFSLLHVIYDSIFLGSPLSLHYFSSTHAVRRVWGWAARWGIVQGGEADFSWAQIKDADGTNIGLSIEPIDSLELVKDADALVLDAHPLVRELRRLYGSDRGALFLRRRLALEVMPQLYRIRVAAALYGPAVYYARASAWEELFSRYAARHGVTFKSQRFVIPELGSAAEGWKWALKIGRRLIRIPRFQRPLTHSAPQNPARVDPRATVAVSYQGKGVGSDPGNNSDLFWLPPEGFPGSRVLVYFKAADDPLDAAKYRLLQERSVQAVALSSGARTAAEAPLWAGPSAALLARNMISTAWRFLPFLAHRGSWRQNSWLFSTSLYFHYRYFFWRSFFKEFQVRINVDYNDWAADRLAEDQAMNDLGGLSVSYQRADEAIPNFHRARASHVHFSYSPAQFDKERQSGSITDHGVSVGYVLDGAFSAVRPRAQELRRRLQENGAEFIVCYLDENSYFDKRYGPSHEFRAESYHFLLSRLLEDPSLGLIFKPKKAATLRHRLGPHAALLDQALKTGRCHLFDGGAVATPNFPCEAGLAADVTVGLLTGTTAAMECALAGCKTVLLDREGMKFHPDWQRWRGRIVWADWQELWAALTTFRRHPESLKDFGDWEPYLEESDPFRDEQAGMRIAGYMGSLVSGLAEGMPALEARDQASECYRRQWGADKVQEMDLLLSTAKHTHPGTIGKRPSLIS